MTYFSISPLSRHYYGVTTNTGWLGIRILCQSGGTCLPETCLSKLALKNPTKGVCLV